MNLCEILVIKDFLIVFLPLGQNDTQCLSVWFILTQGQQEG